MGPVPQPLLLALGPPCDSGFLEEAGRTEGAKDPTTPPEGLPARTHGRHQPCHPRASPACRLCLRPSVPGHQPSSPSRVWLCQSKHSLSFISGRVSCCVSSGLHSSLASSPGAHLLGIAICNSGGARGCPGPSTMTHCPLHMALGSPEAWPWSARPLWVTLGLPLFFLGLSFLVWRMVSPWTSQQTGWRVRTKPATLMVRPHPPEPAAGL